MKLFWHRHRMKPVSVQHLRPNPFPVTEMMLILHRCTRCGGREVKVLEGCWATNLFISGVPDVRPKATAAPTINGDRS